MNEESKINPVYEENISGVRAYLDENGFVLLKGFFAEKISLPKRFKGITSPGFAILSEAKFSDAALNSYLEKLTGKSVFESKVLGIGKGDYFLQHADEPFEGFEAVVFFLPDEWDDSFRGEFTFIRDAPLIVSPEDNCLFIVKRDNDTGKFIKKVTYLCDTKYYALDLRLR